MTRTEVPGRPGPDMESPTCTPSAAPRAAAARSEDERIEGHRFEASLNLRKADLHLHSNYSYDVLNLPGLSPRALYDRAVERGMGLFTLTDHETIRGIEALARELREEFGDAPPIPIVSGIEIKVKDRRIGHTVHVNVLGLDRAQMSALARRRKNLDHFLDFCRKEDLYHAYNHPFWFEGNESATVETVSSLIAEFPVIELNAGRIPELNGRTLELARHSGRELVATSDSHTGRVGRAYTLAPGDSGEAYLRNVLAGRSAVVPRHSSVAELRGEVRSAIEMVFSVESPIELKRTFLRSHRAARYLLRAVLRSNRLMEPTGWQLWFRRGLGLAAWGAAGAAILQQRMMHRNLDLTPDPS